MYNIYICYIAFPLREALSSKLVSTTMFEFPWTVALGSFPFCNCVTWWNETIRVTDSQGELSHRICCGPSHIYFYQSSEIFLWDMSIFSHVHISLMWIFILTLSLVKMMIIIRMYVRCRCCLFFFILDYGEDYLHFLVLIFGFIFLDLCFLVLQ